MNKEKQFRKILLDYAEGKLSNREVKKLEHLILKYPVGEPWDWEDNTHKEVIERKIREKLEPKWPQRKKANNTRILIRWAVAACLACFCTFIYFYSTRIATVKTYEIAKAKAHTSNEVVLIMPDGKEIKLGASASISDFRQNMHLNNLASQKDKNMITVKVPSQRQFNLTLDDGTKVWLNAGAVLRFTAIFNRQSERVVNLEGEGYFEVVSNKAQPFKVMALGTEVKVTGTKFNVQAFEEDHAVKTSLLEGHVTFSMDKKVYQLQAGQQTLADIDKKQVLAQSFDADKLLSWKSGYFVFDNTELLEVMKTASRWYNVNVVAQSPINNKKIGGTFPNDVPLSEFLADLSLLSGLKFKIKGEEVLIMN
ncbi:FecR family protein [Pedobacter frigoris]|uniref:FecR family protein n=1 Tax=Pedobacter frigoris TaxID=2571272 RepID=UPI00292D0605|nr:FecR domain-containing protein [Pedobacter frigoris]